MDDDDSRLKRGRSGEDADLISGLPDELLHGILVRLRSARAAARTSALSRRWRHVWRHLPELLLLLDGPDAPPPPAAASFADAVDGALAGCLAPTLERLTISLSADRGLHVPAGRVTISLSADDRGLRVPAGRVAPWLRFAAGRVAGDLCLYLPPRVPPGAHAEDAELELPVCGRAKAITLFPQLPWRLRPHPAGMFAALTALRIHCCRMEGGELSALVCTQCPRLSELSLSVTLVAIADVSIRSDSLLSLWCRVMNTQRLEVVAPRLEELTLFHSIQVHVSTPKLAKLVWLVGAYNPPNHRFLDVGRRLWLLQIGMNSAAASLMQQFDEVDVFKLEACIPQGTAGYERFLNETKKLPKCKTLSISLFWRCHGLAPAILHLLRSCNGTRKISLALFHVNKSLMRPCATSCPCGLEESGRIDGIDLGSLDELEISSYIDFHEDFEFLELLFRCNTTALKKLLVNYKMVCTAGETKEVCAKVRGMCGSNVGIEFYVFPNGPDGIMGDGCVVTDYLQLVKI